MEQPNKIYVSEYKGDTDMGYKSHFVIVTAASDADTARKHVKELIGFDASPTRLIGTTYPRIYNQTGDAVLPVQAKILANNNFHVKNK